MWTRRTSVRLLCVSWWSLGRSFLRVGMHACMHARTARWPSCPFPFYPAHLISPIPTPQNKTKQNKTPKKNTDRLAVQKRKKTAQQQQPPQSGSAPSTMETAGAEEGEGEEVDEVDFLSSQPRVAKGMAATLALLRNTGGWMCSGLGRGVRSSLSYRVVEGKRRRQRLEVDQTIKPTQSPHQTPPIGELSTKEQMVGRDKDKKTLYDVGAIGKVGGWPALSYLDMRVYINKCMGRCTRSIPQQSPNDAPPPP